MKIINSLYLHFPFCKHLCNYCDFYKHKLTDSEQIDEFEKFVEKHFNYHANFLKENAYALGKLKTFYIGGGTPSLWGSSGVDFLKQKIKLGQLELADDSEFTIEVDPDCWSEEEIMAWESIGVNRFSIGVQAYSENLLSVMDRTHKLKDVEKTIKYFHERGLNFSVDLMLGLPKSGSRNLKEELDLILEYDPPHLSVYILKTRKNYPHNQDLPEDDRTREEYLFVSKYLRENGYDHYEVSNFAKPGYKSKHNLSYWQYNSVAAIGPNGTGLLVNEDQTLRYQWKSKTIGVEVEKIEGESLIIEKLFLGTRFQNDFDFDGLFEQTSDRNKLDELVIKWTELGYLVEGSTRNKINLTPLGYLMNDSLLDDIFKEIQF